jgi:tetratricopeptide (TPR) repeat protein
MIPVLKSALALIILLCFSFCQASLLDNKANKKENQKEDIQAGLSDTLKTSVEKSLRNAISENTELSKANDEIKKKLNELERYSKWLFTQNDKLRSEKDELVGHIKAIGNVGAKIKELEEKLASSEKQNSEMKLKLEETGALLNKVSAENKALSKRLQENELEKELEDLQERLTIALNENEKAMLDLSEAVSEKQGAQNESAILHYNLGVKLFEDKDFSLAAKEFEAAVKMDPFNFDAYYNLGIIYDDYLGNDRAALLCYKKYLELSTMDSMSSDEILNEVKRRLAKAQLREKSRVDSPIDQTIR